MIKNPKILVIDDIKDNILTIKALIKKNYPSAVIITALSGTLGIELAKSTIPDVILLDILMPDKDGFAVTKEIKKIQYIADIPIIFITALKEETEIKIKALNSGAEGFLTKPIDEASLIATVSSMLRIREAQIYKSNENKRLSDLVFQKTLKLKQELNERLIIEKKLANSEEQYRGLIDNLDSGVIIHSADTKIISINQRAADLLNLKISNSKDMDALDPHWKFLSEDLTKLDLSKYPVNIIARTLKHIKNYIIGISHINDSTIKWVTCNGFPRFDTDNNLFEIVISITDISEKIESEKKLKFAANNDHLTRLFNRRQFENTMDKYNKSDLFPLSIAIADINGLKLINDAFGHIYGDDMLIATANVILKSVDSDDIVARIGGDEFGIIMPNTTPSEAEIKIRKIHKYAKGVKVQSISLSISVGFDTKHTAGVNLYDISRSAEDIMYRQKLIEIPSMRSNAIETILTTLYEKDTYSEKHSRSVSNISGELALAHGLDDQLIKDIKTAGLVHDIGKIIIPLDIINKNGPLTTSERKIINSHSEIGFRILNSSSQLRTISNIVLNHHERWDGNGYPRGIKGDNIPIESRIIAIADAFDAMTSKREYREIFTIEEAKKEIVDNAGTQFDPDLANTFVNNIQSIIK